MQQDQLNMTERITQIVSESVSAMPDMAVVDAFKSTFEAWSPDDLLSLLAYQDHEIDRMQQSVSALRELRAVVEAAIVAKATEAQVGTTAHGYEVRMNKGRAVTSYDVEKILPHLTAEQKAIACKVSYSLVTPVFAAMLNAGLLPEAINEGVTTKPAVERWEVRKAKGA